MPSAALPPGPSLKQRRQALLAEPGLIGTAFCRRYAGEADDWLRLLFAQATQGNDRQVALVAVGGYGRGELAPGSDLDLLLVHDRRRDIADVANAMWYPIWDQGIHLDHSVRTPREVRAAAEGDLKVALGLLEARWVAGAPALVEQVVARVRDLWQTRADRWLPQLAVITDERHRAQGDVAFLLEPDLKEGRGGLRDLQLLRSTARVSPVLVDTIGHPALQAAGDELTEVRVELQRSGGKAVNRLLLQDQDLVAAALGVADADVLMAQVAGSARAIAWASDDGWRRVRSWLKGPSGRSASADRPIEPGLVLRDGEVTLTHDADPGADPSLAFRLAAYSAEVDLPMSRASLDRLAVEVQPVEGVWPEELRQALIRLVGAGRPAIPAFESLDQLGVIVRLLPEWAAVRNRPQRNAYHRFTVDRHLLETAANASAMVRQVARPDLLLSGALLHDIGKGRGGDHSDVGVALMAELGPRMGFSPSDVAMLLKLIRLHLLLPDTATRRDLDDPGTIATVAAAVEDESTLELLAALTEADSVATGPSAWGPWKAGLMATLVNRVGHALAGHEVVATRPPLTDEQRRLMALGQPQLLAVGSKVTAVCPDRSGLLQTVAGVLALNGVTVRSATTLSDAGSHMALLSFDVAPAFDVLPEWDRVRGDLDAALEGRMDLARRLDEREQHYARRRSSTSAYPALVRVTLDDDASASATVVEVRAPDSGPVLYRIAGALTGCDLKITSAIVSTLGHEVVDTFYVQTAGLTKVGEDATARARIETAVVAALSLPT